MATNSPSITYDNSTDALFRAWVLAYHNALVSGVGLTNTADTGQIDTSTVLKPAAGNTAQGYKIYKFNDGLTDFFIKVEFGSGANGALNPAVWYTIGWATNGAGSLTGIQLSGRFRLNINQSNAAAGALTSLFCFTDSTLAVSHNESLGGTSAIGTLVVIERERTAGTGVVNANSASIFVSASQNILDRAGIGQQVMQETIPASGGVPSFVVGLQQWKSPYPRHSGTWGRGGNVGIYPIIPDDAGTKPVATGIAVGSPTDLPVSTQFSMSLYGTARNYRTSNCPSDTSSWGRTVHIWQ
jgi:hypothetical protein